MAEEVRFQHFEVLRKDDGSLFELGRGAMGITYKAFDTNLRCHVALKVINAAYLNSEVARQRFLREARAAAALRHPNVATVFHLGSEDDNYFYAMEFVDGETVESFMKREGAVPTLMALEVASQVSRALGAAQKQGLVHRDIKPSNLMLVREEDDFTVKVIDFGLAKSAATGEDTASLTAGGFLGTPHFASPEQLDEREIDVRSDIYSLGVTLWYMLAGRTPFSGSLAQVMSQHLHREPPFENLEGQAPEVIALLRHMMAKAPEARPQTPAELRREIEGCEDAVKSGTQFSPRPVADADSFETTVLPEPLTDQPEAVSGAIFAGQYRLLNEVTASDHGRMFRAERIEDKAVVGVLILHENQFNTSEAFTRLENDVSALQNLRQAAFQKIYSLERANTSSFLTLEWLQGASLLDLLRTRRALPLAEAASLLKPLAAAFDELAAGQLSCPDIAAHEVILPGVDAGKTFPPGVMPRFLPLAISGSMPISSDATMVATPFAMMKQTGAFAGNPSSAYVFSVAILAYEMLGGMRGGSSAGGYVPIPGLSEAGNAALRQAMNPSQGFRTAEEFVTQLTAASPAASTAPVAAPPSQPATPPPVPQTVAPVAPSVPATPARPTPPPIPQTVVPPAKGKSPLVLILAIVGAVVLIGGGLAVWQGIAFVQRQKVAKQPVENPDVPAVSPTPDSTPIVKTTPTPKPEPTVDTRKKDYDDMMSVAKQLQLKDDVGGALDAYAAVATKYPDEKESFIAMERIAAGLESRADKLTPGELAALREPLERAGSLKIRSAQFVLGESLRETDPSDSLKWFIAAASQGQTDAMVQAGQMLASGRGVPAPDLPGAVVWFTKASESGNVDGMANLGECYLFGKGTEKDPKRAVELLSQAAGLNHSGAMDMLGEGVYRRGIPGLVDQNFPEALRLISRAAEMGNLQAQGNLGVMYINGEGTPKDVDKAFKLFKEGAEKGHPSCMFYYAMCFQGGVGVKKDPEEARQWYIKAAKAGSRPAIEWCKENGVNISTFQKFH
jgi:serine/threonine protein kinase/TPR repeat protein